MPAMFRWLVCLVLAAFALAGCYNTPVRHLASDAALIKVGESGPDDVLTYLGEPDEQTVLAAGVEKWVYTEYEKSMVKDAPLVGKYFGEPNYGTLTVIMKKGVVVECVYGAWEDSDRDWADDFKWQETQK